MTHHKSRARGEGERYYEPAAVKITQLRAHLSSVYSNTRDQVHDLDSPESPLALESHRVHVKLYTHGGEIRRVISLYLNPGMHEVSVEPISGEASALRVLMTQGEEDTLTLHARLEDAVATRESEESSSALIEPTLYVPMIPAEESRSPLNSQNSDELLSNAPVSEYIYSSHTDQLTLETQRRDERREQTRLAQLEEAFIRSETLLRSWLREPLQRSTLALEEWREGVDVLEALLEEQARELREFDERSLEELNHADSRQVQVETPSTARRILITVEVERAAQYTLEMSYQARSIAWEPIYQAHLTEYHHAMAGSKPRVEVDLALDMAARFVQATGEDWREVRGEFCLYPAPRADFPTLSYPTLEPLSIRSIQRPMSSPSYPRLISQVEDESRVYERTLLDSPSTPTTRLFSDQVRLKLTLELCLADTRPSVEVIARGELDALLPLAGGELHRLLEDEWLGSERVPPCALGEPMELNFGSSPHIQAQLVIRASDVMGEEDLELRLKNLDQHVRTILVYQELSRGVLIESPSEESDQSLETQDVESADQNNIKSEGKSDGDHDTKDDDQERAEHYFESKRERDITAHQGDDQEERSSESERHESEEVSKAFSVYIPLGWVLSADQKRLMRWISIPPSQTERLYLNRRLSDA